MSTEDDKIPNSTDFTDFSEFKKAVNVNGVVLDENLDHLLGCISHAVKRIAIMIRTYCPHTKSGIENNFGDEQLALDVATDEVVFEELKKSGVCCTASSEESPSLVDCGYITESQPGNPGFSVSFDPLDGSSIIDANFAVGSIFGIWSGPDLIGRTGREQVASVIAIYGPRCTLVIALSDPVSENGIGKCIILTLHDGKWEVTNEGVNIASSGKVFAPGNLRATADNPNYLALVNHWISEKYTLRYTGGLVPDVYHILVKGKGVLTNVLSPSTKAKLRLLYEIAPIALIVEACGGASCTPGPSEKFPQPLSLLDIPIEELEQKLGVIYGGKEEVEKCKSFLF